MFTTYHHLFKTTFVLYVHKNTHFDWIVTKLGSSSKKKKLVSWVNNNNNNNIRHLPVFEIPPGQISSFNESSPPPEYLVVIQQVTLFMFHKRLFKTTTLLAHIGGSNIIEYRENFLRQPFSALHDLHELIQTPPGRRVVFGEDDEGYSGPSYCL